MSSTYRFRLAEPSDDEQLRLLLRRVAMPGSMELATHREPNFFQGERVGNLRSQVMVCVEGQERIVGFSVRSVRLAYIDGQPRQIAYLSTLRSYPEVRHGLLLMRGYQFLRELNQGDPVCASVTTIYDDNRVASAILTSRRAGLPEYRLFGHLRTYAISLRSRRPSSFQTLTGRDVAVSDVAQAVNGFNRHWQFAPHWHEQDLSGETTVMSGFDLAHLRLLSHQSRITATCGVWDLESMKQHVVQRYRWPVSWYQAISHHADRLGLGPALPRTGQSLRLLYGCCLSGSMHDPTAFATVLDDVVGQWSGRGYDYLLLGLHAGHPFESIVAPRSRMTLRSSTYLVHWGDSNGYLPHTDRYPPHLELATL